MAIKFWHPRLFFARTILYVVGAYIRKEYEVGAISEGKSKGNLKVGYKARGVKKACLNDIQISCRNMNSTEMRKMKGKFNSG